MSMHSASGIIENAALRCLGAWLAGGLMFTAVTAGVAAEPRRIALADVPVKARIAVPVGPAWLGLGFGSVWISKSMSRTVYRIDPSTNKVSAKIPVGQDAELGVLAAMGSIWIPDTKDRSLKQIDPTRNTVIRTIPLELSGDPEGSISIAYDSVWFVSDRGGTDAGTLSRVELSTGSVAADIAIPAKSHAVEAAFGSVWVTSTGAGSVLRIDPSSNRIVTSIPVHPQPRFVAAGFGSIWVLSQSDGSLARIDPLTNRIVSSIAVNVPGPGGDLAIGDRDVWVSAQGTPVSIVDPATDSVRLQVVGGTQLDTLRVGFGAVWLVDENHGVLRIDENKLLAAAKLIAAR